ncbi:uncharacterized protein [Bemisia tabaci]|uniref:uncharacterized protein n=1 Tax=Bemisia tabaci TaxID=7038 RepID=UPI003B27FEAC
MPPGLPDAKPGVKVIINHPEGFTFGREIKVSAGNLAEIKIGGDRLYSTERMRGMDVDQRKCLFKEDASTLGLPYYMRINCKTECFRNYTFQYCNCSPNFMFFDVDGKLNRYSQFLQPSIAAEK